MGEHISQVHHNRRPFNCSICDFGSSHKSRLEIHIKTVHEEPQDYPCEHCPHICHKMKQHKCDYCDSAFYRRRDKEKHLPKTHNIDLIKHDHNQADLHTLQPVPTAVTQ